MRALMLKAASVGSPRMPLLDALCAAAGPGARVLHYRQRPWASACFSGARYYVTLSLCDGPAAAQRLSDTLPEHEFSVRGIIVIEAAVTGFVAEGARAHCCVELLCVDSD